MVVTIDYGSHTSDTYLYCCPLGAEIGLSVPLVGVQILYACDIGFQHCLCTNIAYYWVLMSRHNTCHTKRISLRDDMIICNGKPFNLDMSYRAFLHLRGLNNKTVVYSSLFFGTWSGQYITQQWHYPMVLSRWKWVDTCRLPHIVG